MQLFHELTDVQAITRNKAGVYRQVKAYRRGVHLYVANGGGYLRVEGRPLSVAPGAVSTEWGTSSPLVTVVDLDLSGLDWRQGQFGRLELAKDPATVEVLAEGRRKPGNGAATAV